MKVIENFFSIADYAVLIALRVKNLHQGCIIITDDPVAVPISPDVFLLQSGKMLVEFFIKVFPVSLPQGNSHTETKNTVNLCFNAIIKYTPQVLFAVIYKWQNWAEPDNGWDIIVTENLEGFKALSGR